MKKLYPSIRKRVGIVVISLATMLIALGTGNVAFASSTPSKVVHKAPATVVFGAIGNPTQVFQTYMGMLDFPAAVARQFHTQVKVEWFATPAASLAALLGGSAQFITLSPNSQLLAEAQGAGSSIVGLMTNAQGGEIAFYGQTKYRSRGIGIGTLKKWSSSSWGIPSIGGVVQLYLNVAFHSQGITYQNVNEEAVGANALAPDLAAHKLDAVATASSSGQPLVDAGQAFPFWYASGTQAYRITGFVPASELMTTKAFANKYAAFTQQVVTANLKNLRYYQANPTKPQLAYAHMPAAGRALISAKQWAEAWPYTRAIYQSLTGLLTQASLLHLNNLLRGYGIVPNTFTKPLAGSVNTSFLLNAYKSLRMKPPTSAINESQMYWLNNKYLGLGS